MGAGGGSRCARGGRIPGGTPNRGGRRPRRGLQRAEAGAWEQLAAAEAADDTAPVAEEEQPADTADEEPADTTDTTAETPEGKTYVIEPGDSLAFIAQEEYGNADYADFLAEVNGIADPSTIQVGQEIIIPDEPPE